MDSSNKNSTKKRKMADGPEVPSQVSKHGSGYRVREPGQQLVVHVAVMRHKGNRVRRRP